MGWVMMRERDRHRSAVFRELRRNHYRDSELPELTGYYGLLAHEIAVHGQFASKIIEGVLGYHGPTGGA